MKIQHSTAKDRMEIIIIMTGGNGNHNDTREDFCKGEKNK